MNLVPARVRTTVILEHTLRPIAPDGSVVYRPKDLGEKPGKLHDHDLDITFY